MFKDNIDKISDLRIKGNIDRKFKKMFEPEIEKPKRKNDYINSFN